MIEDFYSTTRFLNLDTNTQVLVKNLINEFSKRNYEFDLEWMNLARGRLRFTFKNISNKYVLRLIASARLVKTKGYIEIEVRRTCYTLEDKFRYTADTTEEELSKLFTSVNHLLNLRTKKHFSL